MRPSAARPARWGRSWRPAPLQPATRGNYAIPDDEGAPTGDDVGALIGWYLSRDRAPRLEYVTDAAPAVEPALLAAGLGVDGRLPLMTFEATRAGRPPEPVGVELVVPESDDGPLAMMLVQAEAYGSPAPAVEEVPDRRAALDRGAVAIVARDATGTVVGAGCCSPVVDGHAEAAATGVAVSHRRRGIAQALAHRLAWEAIERGAEVPLLMAADKAERRIYERSGLTSVGEILHISR